MHDGESAHSYYNYDADGKRVGIHPRGSVRKEFVYQGPDMLKLLLDRDAEGETLVHYTMGNGLESMRQEAESSFYHYDALGSTYRLTDAVEDVTDTYRYNAWGEILGTTGETFNRHTFVGRERYSMSRNSAYALLGLRYYVPMVGRFWTVDPEIAEENRYLYSRNMASSRLDPTGLIDVSLTFDDGPTKFSQYIMDSLQRHNNPTVGFFWVGTRMFTGLGQQLVQRGVPRQIIGNHSLDHGMFAKYRYYSLLSNERIIGNICAWEVIYSRVTGRNYGPPKYWRAPAWDFNTRVHHVFTHYARYHRGPYPHLNYRAHCGADLSSRDAEEALGFLGLWEPQPAKRHAFCVLKYLKEHQHRLPSGRPVIIGWHDRPEVGAHSADAIDEFLTQADKDPTIAVKDYQPGIGPTAAPTRMELRWVYDNCLRRDPW